MPDTSSTLSLILKSILIGFSYVIPLVAIINTFKIKAIQVKQLFILTSVQAVRLAGIFYFALYLSSQIIQKFQGFSYMQWWFPPLVTFLLSQLFWIKKIYFSKSLLIVSSLLLLVLPSPFVAAYLPSPFEKPLWINFSGLRFFVVETLLNIIVFIFIIITIIF